MSAYIIISQCLHLKRNKLYGETQRAYLNEVLKKINVVKMIQKSLKNYFCCKSTWK